MIGRALLAGMFVAGSVIPAAAQDVNRDRFLLHILIADASFEQPRFDAPEVSYFVTSERQLNDDTILNIVTPSPKPSSTGYDYRDQLGDGDLIRTFAHISINAGDFVVRDPRLLRVQLKSDNLGSPINRTIRLESRSEVAEYYRFEVSQILRGGDLTAEDYERAHAAAVGAIEFKPVLDNYLQVARVLRSTLRSGETPVFLPTSPDKLSNLAGYDDLSFGDKWRFQVEVLDTFMAAPDRSIELEDGTTLREAGIEFGSRMMAELDLGNSDHGGLTVVRPLQNLTVLHSENEDCISLSEVAAFGLDNADAISMNWASQRTFLLDWADCLERMSNWADGRSEEQVIADVAADSFLSQLWKDYNDRISARSAQINVSVGTTGDRLKALRDYAAAISERTN